MRGRSQPTHRSSHNGNLLVCEVIERRNAGLHLDGHNGFTISDNEVDLATTDSHVASENRTTSPGEKAGSDFLASFP